MTAATARSSPNDRIVACDQLVRAGRFDEAEPILAGLVHEPEVARAARKLLAVCRQLQRWGIVGQLERYARTAPGDEIRPDFADESSVLLARRPGASRVILVFTGNARQVWISLHLLHQVLPREDCHIVYLRDSRGQCYLRGVEGLGGDYDETLAGFRDLMASLEARRLYVIGSSGGGYAALRYGLDLGARAILAFAPATDASGLDRALVSTMLGDVPPHVLVDVRALYAAAPDGPRVTVVFAEDNATDAAAGRHLAGLPSVTLHPILSYDGHDVIAQTIVTGEFRSLIDGMLSVP
jgi:hypothetical protein